MDVSEAIYTFYIGGLALDIKPEAIIQLIVILLVGVLAWWSTKDLKRRPEGKKQIVVEYIYTSLMNLVDANMGEKYRDVIPRNYSSIYLTYEPFRTYRYSSNNKEL